jgi:hypothetical protein
MTKAWPGLLGAFISGLFLLLRYEVWAPPRRYVALACLLAVVTILPWHLWQYALYGTPFLREYVGFNMVARLFQTVEGNGGGPWFYAEVVRQGFSWWGYLWAPAYLWGAWKVWRQRDEGALLLLVWMTLPLIVFSAAQTKLGWYISMIYPAVALLIAIALADLLSGRLALGGVAVVMLVCCLHQPVPADGAPDVKRFAPYVRQYVPSRQSLYVMQPLCADDRSFLTAGDLLITDRHFRTSLVFYVDRPLTCVPEHEISSAGHIHRSYVITDQRHWERFDHLGDIVWRALVDGHGYLLARWH